MSAPKIEELDYNIDVCVCDDCGHIHESYPHGIGGGEGSCYDCRSNNFSTYYWNNDWDIYVNEDFTRYYNSDGDKIGREADQEDLDSSYGDYLYHMHKEEA